MTDQNVLTDEVKVKLSTPIKLDLCTGGNFREGFISVDMNPKTKPDIVCNIAKERLPFDDNSVDEIWFMHGPEHIERHFWDFIFMECKRVLKSNCKLCVGYPEWVVCASNYIKALGENDSKKDYWLQTMYGRRYWAGDEHVTAVNSSELQLILESCGYYKVRYCPEEEFTYNSLMVAVKDPSPNYREKVMCAELGLPGTPQSIQEVIVNDLNHRV